MYPSPPGPSRIPPINTTMADLLHEMLKTIDTRMEAFQTKFRNNMDARVVAVSDKCPLLLLPVRSVRCWFCR